MSHPDVRLACYLLTGLLVACTSKTDGAEGRLEEGVSPAGGGRDPLEAELVAPISIEAAPPVAMPIEPESVEEVPVEISPVESEPSVPEALAEGPGEREREEVAPAPPAVAPEAPEVAPVPAETPAASEPPFTAASLTLDAFVLPASESLAAPSRRQEVDWFQSGPYAGAMIGLATLGASGDDLEDDLASLGNTTSADLDRGDLAWRVFGGWRFEQPFSVELGYANLGRAESTIATNAPNVPAFLDDVVETQPFLGRGIELEGRWWVVDTDRFDLGLGAGLWYWTAEIEAIAATGEKATGTETGLDPLLGIDALFRLVRRLDARVGLERYWLEDEGATVVWIGLQGRIL